MSYYTPTGNPAVLTRGASSLIRAEFALIENAFNKNITLDLTTANFIPKVNSAGTAIESSTLYESLGYVNATTPPVGDSSTKLCTTEFASALAFSATLPSQTGSRGKFVTTDGSAASWGNPVGVNATIKSANYTAVAGDNFSQDTTTGGFTVTLPASPSVGDAPILIHDISGMWPTNALVLDPGANKIKGTTGACNCRIANFSAWLVWSGATYGWIFL